MNNRVTYRRRLWSLALVLCTMLAMSLSIVPRAAAATPVVAPHIVVVPSAARPGGHITVSGVGFSPDESVLIFFSGFSAALASAKANRLGAFPATAMTIPDTARPGTTVTVSAYGTTSKRIARATLLIVSLPTATPTATPRPRPTATPAIKAVIGATPAAVNRGGLVTIYGSGFAPGEVVFVYFAAAPSHATQARTAANGVLPPTGLTVPYSFKPGLYTITAVGATSRRVAHISVQVLALNPTITVNPGTVSPGAVVTVTGQGFGRQEQVTLSLNGAALVTVPSVITTTNGTFTATFTVPGSILNGANTVSAIGNSSRVSAVATLIGQLPEAAQFYFAGGLNTATEHSSVEVLNTNAQPAGVRLTFFFNNGATDTKKVTVNPHSVVAIPVATLESFTGVFGLEIKADRQIMAQLTITRDGKDGDTLLGNTGLGEKWYLAEGYTGLTFHETVSILNPDFANPAYVTLRILPLGGGPGKTVVVSVPPHTNAVTDVNALMPGKSVSIIATSTRPVVVERTLTFSSNGYGLTTRAGTNSAATSWLFAEGTTVNHFQTFLTILNPNSSAALVTASFFGRTGGSLGSKTILVPALSRANLKLNDFLNAEGIASVVTSDLPVVVERPEYFGSPNGFNIAGSDVFGRNGAGVRWSFPAGNTTAGTSEFLLVYNPSAKTVPIVATFYGSDGKTIQKTIDVPPTVRWNIDVGAIAPGLAPIHGAVLHSTNGLGFVVEQTVFAQNYSTLRSTEGLAQ